MMMTKTKLEEVIILVVAHLMMNRFTIIISVLMSVIGCVDVTNNNGTVKVSGKEYRGVNMFKYAMYDNNTGVLSYSDLSKMVEATDIIGKQFSQMWGISEISGSVVTNLNQLGDERVLFSWDIRDPNVPDALGYHDEIGGIPYAKILVEPLLQQGADTFQDTGVGATFLSVFQHELWETVVDEYVDDWVLLPSGVFLSKESSDPVQSVLVPITLADGSTVYGSDAVGPSYFDAQASYRKNVRYDLAWEVTAPFQLLPGGYQIIYDPSKLSSVDGPISNIFGSEVKQWMVEMKKNNTKSRMNKRLNRNK